MYNSNLQVNYRNLTPSVFLQRVNTALAENLSYFEEQESPESRRAFSATIRKLANDTSNKFLEVNICANSERQLSDVNLFLMRNLTAVKCSFGVLDSKNNTITLYMLLNLKKGELNMSKETISDIWGFDQPSNKEKSGSATNSCPNILCVMGNCTESSMQIHLKFDEPATECKLEILKY